MTSRPSTNHATRANIVAMAKLMDEIIVKGDDGFVAFKEPWTDELVAEKIGCSINSVRGTRLELYGKLRSKPGADDARVIMLESLVRELAVKYNDLVKTLALNRVVEVKHLVVSIPEFKNGASK